MNRPNSPVTHAIELSLEIAAERAGDLTPRVYALLFARQPQMEALFWRDRDAAIRGEMLARAFETILDFVGERRYAHHLLRSERITHEGYDVPRDVFMTFFGVLVEAIEEACGADWTEEMSSAWRRTLTDIARCVEHPDDVPA